MRNFFEVVLYGVVVALGVAAVLMFVSHADPGSREVQAEYLGVVVFVFAFGFVACVAIRTLFHPPLRRRR